MLTYLPPTGQAAPPDRTARATAIEHAANLLGPYIGQRGAFAVIMEEFQIAILNKMIEAKRSTQGVSR